MSIKEILGLRKGKQKTESKEEIVLNETIQDVFFGVKFGATVDEVIEGFAKYDLVPDGEMERERLYFVSKKSDCICFGGFAFVFVEIRFHNGRFWQIKFCIPYKTEKEAKTSTAVISDRISEKYKICDKKIFDNDTYLSSVYGVSIDNRRVAISAVAIDGVYATLLEYSDISVTNNEL